MDFNMALVRIWYVYGVLLVFSSASESCPEPCGCFGNIIDCSDRELFQVPKIPKWVEELNMGENPNLQIDRRDLSGLMELQSLNLNEIRLKRLPDLGAQPTVKKLSLENNKIKQIDPSFLEQFQSLLELKLGKNSFSAIQPSLWDQKSLKKLDLNANRISRIFADEPFRLPSLTSLRLSRNDITAEALRNLTSICKSLPNLKTLDLNRNSIKNLKGHPDVKGLMFQHLANITLRTLKLRRNQLDQLQAGIFYGLGFLTTLQLDNNTNITEVNNGWLFGLSALQVLTLSHNNIGAVKEKAWDSTKRLEVLDLSFNELGCRHTDLSFKGLSHLEKLFISHNCLANLDPEIFGHLPMLKTLDISHNQIQWSVEDSTGTFQNLVKLENLDLSYNKIETIHSNVFEPLKSLTRLDLSGNNLKTLGQNPFANLPNLQKFHFNTSSLVCNCHLLWLPSWLKEESFVSSVNPICGSPPQLKGKSVFDLDELSFSCDDVPQTEIIVSPNNKTVLFGQNMTLECVALTADEKAIFIWNKDRVTEAPYKVATTMNVDSLETLPIYRVISRLTIANVTHDTAGEYQCIVRTTFGPGYSVPARIIVYQYPYFTKTPSSMVLKEGTEAELNCVASGYPTPQISWEKKDGAFLAAKERRLHFKAEDSSYRIKPLYPRDDGIYICKAKNEAGTISVEANITVTHTPNFSRPLSNQDVALGQSVVLECQGTGRPKPTVTWYKDDVILIPDKNLLLVDEGQFLILLNAKENDAGTYRCTLGNSLGAQNRDIILTVRNYHVLPTKTELIMYIVVACVVLTSLFWVCIIYKARRSNKRDPEDPNPAMQLYNTPLTDANKNEANRTPLLNNHGLNPLPTSQDSSSEHSSGKDSGVGDSAHRSNEDLRRNEVNLRRSRIMFPDSTSTLRSAVPIYGEIDDFKPHLSTFGLQETFTKPNPNPTYASLRRGSASRLCPVSTPSMPVHGSLPRHAYRSHSGSLSHPKARKNNKRHTNTVGRSVTPPLFMERGTWHDDDVMQTPSVPPPRKSTNYYTERHTLPVR